MSGGIRRWLLTGQLAPNQHRCFRDELSGISGGFGRDLDRAIKDSLIARRSSTDHAPRWSGIWQLRDKPERREAIEDAADLIQLRRVGRPEREVVQHDANLAEDKGAVN